MLESRSFSFPKRAKSADFKPEIRQKVRNPFLELSQWATTPDSLAWAEASNLTDVPTYLFTNKDNRMCMHVRTRRAPLYQHVEGSEKLEFTFLAVSSNSIAFSYWACSIKKSEQRASRAGSDFSSRSSAISCRAPNCCVAKASSSALEKCPACKIKNESLKTRINTAEFTRYPKVA